MEGGVEGSLNKEPVTTLREVHRFVIGSSPYFFWSNALANNF